MLPVTQLTAYPILVGAIIAVVEFIKTYVPQVNGGITIILAAVLGGLAGLFHVEGIDPVTGVVVGLLAVGVDIQANNIGNNPNVTNTVVTPINENNPGATETKTV